MQGASKLGKLLQRGGIAGRWCGDIRSGRIGFAADAAMDRGFFRFVFFGRLRGRREDEGKRNKKNQSECERRAESCDARMIFREEFSAGARARRTDIRRVRWCRLPRELRPSSGKNSPRGGP